MSVQPRLRDLGITIGALPTGPGNAITDVPGVAVGHVTLSDGSAQTGVTAIRAHPGHPFRDKLPAAAHVLNGFGKSIGLMQVAELGTAEAKIKALREVGATVVDRPEDLGPALVAALEGRKS